VVCLVRWYFTLYLCLRANGLHNYPNVANLPSVSYCYEGVVSLISLLENLTTNFSLAGYDIEIVVWRNVSVYLLEATRSWACCSDCPPSIPWGIMCTSYVWICASFVCTTVSGTMTSLESIFATCASTIVWLPDDVVIILRSPVRAESFDTAS
jgi:hypothetical protein